MKSLDQNNSNILTKYGTLYTVGYAFVCMPAILICDEKYISFEGVLKYIEMYEHNPFNGFGSEMQILKRN